MRDQKMLSSVVLVFILTLLKPDVAEGFILKGKEDEHVSSFLASTQQRTGTALVSASASDSVLRNPHTKDKGNLVGEPEEDERIHVPATVKYPLIWKVHLRLERVFGRYTETWWLDWKLWVGLTFWLAIWAKWLIHGYDEIYYQRALYAFGINIVILHHLQYEKSILVGMLGVCVLLGVQAVFQSWHWFKGDPHEEDDDDFVCDTLYLDLGLPLEQVVVLFVGQFGVWWFFMTSIIGNLDFANVNYLFWLWSYLVMQMTMIFNRGADSVLGNAFPVADVFWIFQVSDQARWHLRRKSKDEEPNVPFQVTRANIFVRGVMGFFCNSILREIMAYTIPLMLMSFSEPMDFVVYCVGVNFICTLDDMAERDYVMTMVTARGTTSIAGRSGASFTPEALSDALSAEQKASTEESVPPPAEGAEKATAA